jgi:enoyl-CoA hydratase/carnithine racemase
MSAPIHLTREGPIARLIFNRPDKKNALTKAMWAAIPELLAQAAEDPDVLALIVRGEGGCFAAGADIAEFPQVYSTPETSRHYSDLVQAAGRALAAFPKPSIAVIRGACVGGGCGLALARDLRFAKTGAKIGITPGKLGLAYTLADTRRLVDAVGPSRAKDMLFSGRLVEADEALRIGLVDRVAPPDALASMTLTYLKGLLENSQYSIRAMKATINAIADGQAHETADSYAAYLDGFDGADFREGYAAFMAKRPPVFPFR